MSQLEESRVTEILNGVDFLAGIDPNEVAGPDSTLELADGDVLMERESDGTAMYVVLDGSLEVYVKDRSIRVLGPGEYAGARALVESGARLVSARARGKAIVLPIERERFESIIRTHPAAILAVSRKFARRLRESASRNQAHYEQVNMLVHDLLNMVGVFESAEIVKDMLPPEHEAQEFLGYILATNGEFTTLMRSTLRSLRGQGTYEMSAARIDLLVRDCLARDLARHADVKHARVEVRATGALKPVRCNPVDIRRVVSNLVINGVQAAGDQAHIVVSVTQEDRKTTLAVTDNGPGIPAHVRERLFDSSFTTKANGNGIGLSSCRQIIETKHGGRLRFESVAGKGTTFICELPG